MARLRVANDHAKQRAHAPVPESLKQMVKKARTERIANKTRELKREQGGEVLLRTIKRRQKGPPADVLVKMTPGERKMDKVVRSVSEVGYVAMMKKKKGMKIRDPEAGRILD